MNGPVEKEVGNNELRVVVPPGNPASYVQLIQKTFVPLEEGKSYRLSFEAKLTGEAQPLPVGYMQDSSPFASYGLLKDVRLSEDWNTYEFVFIALPVEIHNRPVVRFQFGNQAGTISFRNISLTAVSN